jgi:hypothetical protein
MTEMMKQKSGNITNRIIVTLVVNFIVQDASGMKMPFYFTEIAFLVIMGNYIVSYNHQPAKKNQRDFDLNPFPHILIFSANVATFKMPEKINSVKTS